MSFLLLLLAVQITPEQKTELMAGVAQVREMDQELQQLQDNQDALAKSSRARVAEIAVLKRRYPEIELRPDASVGQIYRALYATRNSRADKLRPLAKANVLAAHEASCRAAQSVQSAREKIENAGGLDKLSLEERLAWQKNMDAVASAEGTCPSQ